jgi:peptidoglycan/LPS O-acetylase OafA/YrhL
VNLRVLSRTFPSVGTHMAALDGLRGIAVLLVILSHASLSGIDMIPGVDMSGTGKSGVWLFFVLSSFLLMHQFLTLDAERRLDGAAWWRYAWRRLLRIYPLYVVFLLVCWLVPVKTLIPSMTGADVLVHLAVIDAQWHTWSIAVELKYYLLLPFLVLAYVHVARRRFIAATLLAGVGIGVREWLAPEFHVYALSTYLAIFLTGSWLAIAHRHLSEHSVSRSPVFRRACGVVALVLFALLMAMTPSIWGRLLDTAIPLNHWHRSYTLFALLWGGVLLGALHAPSVVQKAFAWLPLRVLGVVSFSAYLWHAIVLENLGWLPDWGAGARAALVFAAIVVVSVVSYLLIERPFLRIGAKPRRVQTHGSSNVVTPRLDSAAAADEVRS